MTELPTSVCTPPKGGRGLVREWNKRMRFTPELDERATVLGVLGQPTRLRLLYIVGQLGEVCVCDLSEILGVTQSGVSQHLAKLKTSGLVRTRRDAQTIFYRLTDEPALAIVMRAAFEGLAVEPRRAEPAGSPRQDRARPSKRTGRRGVGSPRG